MAFLTVCFGALTLTSYEQTDSAHPPFLCRILNIICLRTKKQMVWIHARRSVTTVKHKQTIVDLAFESNV